jgi:PilZ domain-containing protein
VPSPATPSLMPVIDRRLDVRYVGPVSGCYTFSQEVERASVEVYACRTQSISAAAAAITGPVQAKKGTIVTARFDHIGVVHGHVERLTPDGFVFMIAASDKERVKLAAKISWLKNNRLQREDDKREHKRFQPRDPRSVLIAEDGSKTKCFIIDLSLSGAAVSAQDRPKVGTNLTVGAVKAKVIRHLDVGFAVQFDATQPADSLERMVTGFQAKPEASGPAAA